MSSGVIYLLEMMSMSAVRSLGDARCPQPVPDEVWDKYQTIKKEHGRGTAAWRKIVGGRSIQRRRHQGRQAPPGRSCLLPAHRMSG